MNAAERDAVAALLVHRMVRGADPAAAAAEQVAEEREPALVAAAMSLAQWAMTTCAAPGQDAAVHALPPADQASARWLLTVAAACYESLSFSSMASSPGRMDLDPRQFLRFFAPHFLPAAKLFAPLPIAALIAAWWFPIPGLVAAVLLVAFSTWYIGRALLRIWRYTAGKFKHGCINPAVVVALEPCRVAVLTDLDRTSSRPWPVVKVLPVLLDQRICPGLAVGRRLATVSYYFAGPADADGQAAEHWADFMPDVVDCFVADRAAIERTIHSLAPKEWRDLATALDQSPDRTVVGLHRVRLGHTDEPPPSPSAQGAAAAAAG